MTRSDSTVLETRLDQVMTWLWFDSKNFDSDSKGLWFWLDKDDWGWLRHITGDNSRIFAYSEESFDKLFKIRPHVTSWIKWSSR